MLLAGHATSDELMASGPRSFVVGCVIWVDVVSVWGTRRRQTSQSTLVQWQDQDAANDTVARAGSGGLHSIAKNLAQPAPHVGPRRAMMPWDQPPHSPPQCLTFGSVKFAPAQSSPEPPNPLCSRAQRRFASCRAPPSRQMWWPKVPSQCRSLLAPCQGGFWKAEDTPQPRRGA